MLLFCQVREEKRELSIAVSRATTSLSEYTTPSPSALPSPEPISPSNSLSTPRLLTGNPDRRQTKDRWCDIAINLLQTQFSDDQVEALIPHLGSDTPINFDAVTKFLWAHRGEYENIIEVLPPHVLTRIKREAMEAYRKAIQDKWTPSISTSIKYTLQLSREKMTRLSHLLSFDWQKSSNKWQVSAFEKVRFPKLPGRIAVEQHVAGIKSKFRLTSHGDGLCTTADVYAVMADAVNAAIDRGYFYVDQHGCVKQECNQVNTV